MDGEDRVFGDSLAAATRYIFGAFFLVPLVMLLAGCATQRVSSPANNTPADNTGSAKGAGTATILPHGVRLFSVNGETISMFASGAEVPAGPVVAVFDVDPSDFQLPDRDHTVLSIRFQASAGVTYIITGRRGDGRLCAFPKLEDGQPDLTNPAGCITRE